MKIRFLNVKTIVRIALAMFASTTLVAASPVASTNRIAIKAGHLFDVAHGQVLERQIILIENGLIKAVGPEGSVAIPEGTIYRHARGDTPDDQFADKGYLTPLGRERLMTLLSDSPPTIFPDKIHVQALPRYITVGALVRLVDQLQAQ